MKKTLLFALCSLIFSLSNAQVDFVDITPSYGIHFGGKVRFYEGDLKFKDAGTYGLTISVPVAYGISGEFAWSRSDSRATFYPFRPGGIDRHEFKVASNYFLLSGMKEVGSERAKAFGGLSLGMAWFDVTDSYTDDVFRFAIGINGGAKIMLTDNVGIRLQGRLLMPVYFAGVGFWAGGGGSGLTLNAGSTMLQGDLSAGLTFRFNAGGGRATTTDY